MIQKDVVKLFYGSVSGKLLSFYLLPSILSWLGYNEKEYMTVYSIFIFILYNLLIQMSFNKRYEKQSLTFLKDFLNSLIIGGIIYGFVMISLGANPFEYIL